MLLSCLFFSFQCKHPNSCPQEFDICPFSTSTKIYLTQCYHISLLKGKACVKGELGVTVALELTFITSESGRAKWLQVQVLLPYKCSIDIVD